MTDKRSKDPTDEIASRLFQGLNHGLRREILAYLMREPASAKTLSRITGVPLGSLSYHLSRVLYEECDLIEVVQRNQRRGALEKVFALKTESFIGAIDWPEIPPRMRAGVQGLALKNFLDAAIPAMDAQENSVEGTDFMYRPMLVDEEGKREIDKAAKALTKAMEKTAARCSGLNPDDMIQLVVGYASFKPCPLPEDDDK